MSFLTLLLNFITQSPKKEEVIFESSIVLPHVKEKGQNIFFHPSKDYVEKLALGHRVQSIHMCS